ncbi:Mu transposase C-terminal domain-containing protein [Chitinimonas viridis]|uniref:Mu transposase C-terminal domain-containing protein n=1 Tax=Chitinimonas viridis TaxID=664880 RepID=A0ABT8B8V7_9NEIS|nr:Mu transposase C-terminal domain-containing protein [Chitinimonas viridis]MDN3578677.1 Mu transposase C-terminal domain-containing protein [Chitinimonas viridis]
MPESVSGIFRAAKRDGWAHRARSGRGGGVEYAIASLPTDIQAQIKQRAAASIVKAPIVAHTGEVRVQRGVVGVQQCLPGLNDAERLVADARKGVLLALKRIQAGAGCSQEAALTTLLTQAAAGEIEPLLLTQLRAAKTARGRKSGSDLPSHRTLMRWLALGKVNDLAPKKVQPDMALPDWAKTFLMHYRQPHKPTVVDAYARFAAEWSQSDADVERVVPSIHAVRRFLDKLPADLLARGRHTGAELKALLPYVRRDWSVLRPNDVWVGDGHGLKAQIAHPDHGKPFVPEVTLVLDGASRMVVGWSLALSENQIAVSDAIRYGVQLHGKCLIYYSDNGAGQVAKSLDDPTLGCLPRLNIHHETGIPGNPQGRGLIERAHKTILLRLAEQFPTFRGGKMDKETLRKTSRAIESALKRGETPPQLPTWNQLLDGLEQVIAWYNNEHQHSELPRNPATGKRYTPAAYYAAHIVAESIEQPDDEQLRDLFRPYVLRAVDRGWVRLWHNRYFADDLAQLNNGSQVRVGYDIHDANSVVIRDLEGRFICTAAWNGNTRAAFPIPFVERLAGDRAERMIQRGQEIIDKADAELARTYSGHQPTAIAAPSNSIWDVPALEGELVPDNVISLPTPATARRPIFSADYEKFDWLIANPDHVSAEDRTWLAWYRTTSEHQDIYGSVSAAG